ncbi:MAG: hypothetical protein ACK4E8_02980 [Lacibacter sp.]
MINVKRIFSISIILFFFTLNGIRAFSQCTGKIENNNGSPVANASVTCFAPNGKSILAFSISDKYGAFTLKCPVGFDSVVLQISHLQYKTIVKRLPITALTNFAIQLEAEVKSLPEVVVKPQGIYQRKDTINYPAELFIQKQDMVVADFLKRLPGIEVTQSGEVRYQGRPINRYYIEGLDLLEGRYSIANQNMPADAVRNVQIIENHQPVKVLDSLVQSNRAALNIQLKDSYKSKLFGSGKAGVGLAPLLGDLEFTPMRFNAAAQQIGIFKYNNAGRNNSSETTNHMAQDAVENFLADIYGTSPSFSIPFPANPSVSRERYLFNNEHVLSFNSIKKLKNNYEFKIFVDGFTDQQQLRAGQKSSYFFPTDTIIIDELNQKNIKTNQINSAISINRNTSQGYMRNIFRGRYMYDIIRGFTQLSGNTLNQRYTSESNSFSNDFSFLSRRNKKILGIGSYIGLFNHPEALRVWPGVFADFFNNGKNYDYLHTPLNLQTFYTNNYLQLSHAGSKFYFEQKYNLSFIKQNYNASLTVADATATAEIPAFNNSFVNSETVFGATFTGGANLKRLQLQASFPVHVHKFFSAEKGVRVLNETRLPLNYSIATKFAFNGKFSTTLQISNQTYFKPPFHNAGNYNLSSFRSIVVNQPFVKQNQTQNINTQLSYRNVLKNFFSFFQLSYKKQDFNYFHDFSFTGPLNKTIIRNRNNNLREFEALVSAQKFYPAINSTGKMVIFYVKTFSQHLLQEQLSEFINERFGFRFSGNTAIKNYHVDYKFENAFLNTGAIIQKNKSLTVFHNYRIAAGANLPKLWFLKTIYEYNAFRQGSFNRNSFHFLDFSVRKRFEKTRFDLELLVQNITNTKSFGAIVFMNNLLSQQYFDLRPAQAMLKVSYNFK